MFYVYHVRNSSERCITRCDSVTLAKQIASGLAIFATANGVQPPRNDTYEVRQETIVGMALLQTYFVHNKAELSSATR